MAKNFLDIKEGLGREAQVIIVPFGFEATTTYGGGADKGPGAIIKASSQVELFDEELWQETYKKVAIETVKEPKNIKKMEAIVGDSLKNKKLPIILGGEHSITQFIIGQYKKSGFDDFSILQFDAHADLRDGYLGKKYSHAAAMRRSLDYLGINLVQVGIRNISNENDELNFWEKNQSRIKTFWAKDKKKWQIEEIVEGLKNKVYISFDVDVFDCGIMPSTGTPEPGGLDWYEAINILRAVCAKKTIIGADFVELAPIKGLHAPDFLVAKLIYKLICYIYG
ncbi:MAG: agmatinase [Candidatus Portnoybacteria bacterium]|nr:agmatinase [Candidatus Portnoybacteria bacterium]MDD4982453.1 agmatinase [Candidatus Portnoybacteria bacterium]